VRQAGISGSGTLARMTFRVKAMGDPGIAVGEILARDATNRNVVIEASSSSPVPQALPSRSVLNPNIPNPFNPATEFSFVLARDGQTTLRIYTLNGRLIRTLLNEELPAGPHAFTWHGTDDSGRQVSSGSYLVRLDAPDCVQNRQITLIK